MKNLTILLTTPKDGRADVVSAIEKIADTRVSTENLGDGRCVVRINGVSETMIKNLREKLPAIAEVVDFAEAA